jgi:phage gpG-like protein
VITVELTGDRELAARFDAMPGHVRAGLARIVARLGLELQRRVEEKLSGEVLRGRTGGLRSSINTRTQNTPTSVTATVRTNIRYAAAHEYGFQGAVSLDEHLGRVTQAFGCSIRPTNVTMRAHERRMNLPERSFPRSALADLAQRIEEESRIAMEEALER